MALYYQQQVTTVGLQDKLYSTKDGTMVNATRHGAWRRGADRLEHAEADLTCRIGTTVDSPNDLRL